MVEPLNNNNHTTRLRDFFSRVGYWLRKLLPLFGIIMPLAYIGVGGFILLSERSKETLQPAQRYGLAALVIIYGIFRAYRLIKTQKVNDENE